MPSDLNAPAPRADASPRRGPLIAALAAVVAVGLASPAAAALVHLDFDLAASGFGPMAAVDPVVGRFQLTFDNAANIGSTDSGLVVTGFSLPLAPRYAYRVAGDLLTLGTDVTPGTFGVATGIPGFGFVISNASAAYAGGDFIYSDAAGLNFAGRTVLTPVTAGGPKGPGGVPEPSAWALLIAGFAAAGGALRARRASSRRLTP